MVLLSLNYWSFFPSPEAAASVGLLVLGSITEWVRITSLIALFFYLPLIYFAYVKKDVRLEGWKLSVFSRLQIDV